MSLLRLSEPRKWLFCFAHPDDELAVAATMKRLLSNGHELYCLWTHSTDTRKSEAIAGARHLGIPESNLYFLSGTDGSICDELLEILPTYRDIVSKVNPDTVAVGAFEQGHLDHDATRLLVHECFQGEILEFPLYHWYRFRSIQRMNQFTIIDDSEVFPLHSEEIRMKISMARLYPSQTIFKALTLNHWYEKIIRKKFKTIEREILRIPNTFHFAEPNHPPKLAKKIKKHHRWKRWEKALARFNEHKKGTIN